MVEVLLQKHETYNATPRQIFSQASFRSSLTVAIRDAVRRVFLSGQIHVIVTACHWAVLYDTERNTDGTLRRDAYDLL